MVKQGVSDFAMVTVYSCTVDRYRQQGQRPAGRSTADSAAEIYLLSACSRGVEAALLLLQLYALVPVL